MKNILLDILEIVVFVIGMWSAPLIVITLPIYIHDNPTKSITSMFLLMLSLGIYKIGNITKIVA